MRWFETFKHNFKQEHHFKSETKLAMGVWQDHKSNNTQVEKQPSEKNKYSV